MSHHRDDEAHRTYRVGGVRVCARCLGLYPVMGVGLVVQFVFAVPLELRAELGWTVLLFLPGLVDWAVGRFRPDLGRNAWRTLTGAMLGLSLARTLYVHVQRPFPPALQWQLALAGGAVVVVWTMKALLLSER